MIFLSQDAQKEPMFCLETAIKLLAFSWVVYDEKSAPAASKSMDACSHGAKNKKQAIDFHKEDSQSLGQVGTSNSKGAALAASMHHHKKQQSFTFYCSCMRHVLLTSCHIMTLSWKCFSGSRKNIEHQAYK